MILIIDDDESVLKQTSEQATKLGAEFLPLFYLDNDAVRDVLNDYSSQIDTVLCDGLHKKWKEVLSLVGNLPHEIRFILVTATPPDGMELGIEVWDKTDSAEISDQIHTLFREYGQKKVDVEIKELGD
ncbi:hypothetical protein HYV12_04480 [Candidatus Dojkabacteria bacterium]|nr:hypothetical protein [Candidatus Dojkabacteria bacterium]